jgi:hypothetical protein
MTKLGASVTQLVIKAATGDLKSMKVLMQIASRFPELGLSLRAGRQEVVFGTGRLFDNNEGPNVKLSFDGFRAIAEGTSVGSSDSHMGSSAIVG